MHIMHISWAICSHGSCHGPKHVIKVYTPKLPCDMFISFQISIIQKHLQKVVNIKKMVLYFLKRYRVPLSCWVTHNVAKSSYIRRKRKTLETVFFPERYTFFLPIKRGPLFNIIQPLIAHFISVMLLLLQTSP